MTSISETDFQLSKVRVKREMEQGDGAVAVYKVISLSGLLKAFPCVGDQFYHP